MFGIEDPKIWSAYLLCFLTTLICVFYSIINWNRSDDNQPSQEDINWVNKEKEIEKSLPSN